MRRSTRPLLFILLLIVLFIPFNSSASKDDHVVLRGSDAKAEIEKASLVRLSYDRNIPSFVRFQKGKGIPAPAFKSWLKERFNGLRSELVEVDRNRDRKGWEHVRYEQRMNGIPVIGGECIAHIRNGKVRTFNGTLFTGLEELPSSPSISKKAARKTALEHVGAKTYKWELASSERWLRSFTGVSDTSYFPKGKLRVVPASGNVQQDEQRLAFAFNIYAHEPVSRAEHYIDAVTGDHLYKDPIIKTVDDTGTAVTGYSGNRTIVADSTGPNSYRLRESGRGNGIETYDLNRTTDYNNAQDFTDSNNYWDHANANKDEYAGDAHWGAEVTYDYFWKKFNRNSIDDQGFKLLSYVHYDSAYGNAFWDGQRMTYGDGPNGNNPFTALDICGHEVTHGLTSRTADLVYQDEPGALNESFSDIFGNAIEYFGKPSNATWEVGEDIGGIRDMSDPKSYGDPDTYKGSDWYTGTGDNGGVHTNSGVQNYWFYLMVKGGSGTNSVGDTYNVTAVGWDTAAAVAYRNLVHYLGQGSEYADARFYSIQAAIDLYGACSQAHKSTVNAWHAVNLGTPFDSNVVADLKVSRDSACSTPLQVEFTPLTSSAGDFKWHFGDGDSSSKDLPTHTYTDTGSYDVTLIASGGCGSDTNTVKDQVRIRPINPLSPVDDTVCSGKKATLTVGGNGLTARWFDAATGGTLLGVGDSFETQPLQSNTSFYAETVPESQKVGPSDNNFGTGSIFSYDQHLIFDCDVRTKLLSVKVYADGGMTRTIELRDSSGSIIEDTTIYIPDGEQRVTLNFDIPIGEDHELGVDGNGADLYRNDNGASYPYSIPNVLTIERSSAWTAPYDYYYFFYDWKVRTPNCKSERKSALAMVDECQSIEDPEFQLSLEVAPNPSKGHFILKGNALKRGLDMTISNSYGKKIRRIDDAQGKQYHLDLSEQAAGIYFLRMQHEEGRSVKRLVIQR